MLRLNEDGFKGIYFNDVPVKNTNTNTLNFTRAFAEIKYGTPIIRPFYLIAQIQPYPCAAHLKPFRRPLC